MTLAALIRKRTTPKPANANPAKAASGALDSERPLARLAELALANSVQTQEANSSPEATLTSLEESAIRAWLTHIEETDPATISDVLDKCRVDFNERKILLRWAEEVPRPLAIGDDRRRCDQCGNLTERGLCLAARRGEINAIRIHEPIQDLLQRCVGYMPKATDPDQRPGRERWPELIQKGRE